jgi:hypothetical protein
MKIIFSCFIFAMISVFGKEMIVDSPKKITAEWEQKVFGIKYGVTTLDKASHEMVSGLIDGTFDKDFIQRIKSEIERHPTGSHEYREYWSNGTLKARLPYKNGRAHGHLHGWYDNGRDAFKGHFYEGVKKGIHITFFRSEPKEHTKEARILTYSDKAKLDGDQETFHATGRLWIVMPYEQGMPDGALEGWDSNHKYFLSAQYKQGVLQKEAVLPPIERPRPKTSLAEKYVDQVIYEFIQIAKKEFGVTPCGTGAGMPFDVERISVDFNVRKKGTVEDARALIVHMTERFTEVINQHEKLRPYLREYPCTPERAEITLNFSRNRGALQNDGSICRITVGNENQIYYRTQKEDGNTEVCLIEPYKDAVKIVHGKKK